ncbi:MAG: lipoyl(octanoyl) transferase LipB [Microcoleaceae cyanobacterium]
MGLISLTTAESDFCCKIYHLGQISYQTAWQWQRLLVDQRRQQPELEDLVLLLEHPPVYTLGQGSDEKFLKFDPHNSNYELHRIERGGEVTYHCPGQLVGYPILNLRRYRQDLHWYLRQLEEVIIQTLAIYGLEGRRISGLTGVWVNDTKVAAIGIKVSRWITFHGFALNVCPDLSGFERIVPCGITDKSVGKLSDFIPDLTVEIVRETIVSVFAKVFNINCVLGQVQDNPLFSQIV